MTGRRALAAVVLATALGVLLLTGTTTGLRLQHAARLALVGLATVAELEIDRVGTIRMFLNPDDAVVTRSIMADGIWEENETHWFTRFVEPGDTVIDVGANVGYYTLLASRLVGEEGRVYAFEPDPTSFALLARNVRMSGARNVVLEQKAVSDQNGTLQLFLAQHNKGDHRIYQTDEGRPAIDVQTVRLDDYVAEIGGPIDFVKLDTQGAETLILAGMSATIDANPDLVMAVEFSPEAIVEMGSRPEDFLETLRGHDFRMFDLGPGLPGILDLNEVTPTGLLKHYRPDSWNFTNLLLVKGFGTLRRLVWDAEAKRRALQEELGRGRPGSEAEQRARKAVALAEAALAEHRDGVAPR